MDKHTIESAIAPCGLSCRACFAHKDGDIQEHARQLKEKLGNFDIYAKRFETLVGDPVFKLYPEFKQMLHYFAQGACSGCRNEQCRLFTQCGVRPCHQDKGIDFCFECDDFPCDHTGFDPHLHERWIAMNQRIKNIGVDAWYEESLTRPRYV